MRTWTLPLLLGAAFAVPELAHAAATFDPHAATEAYLATLTGEAKERSDAYFEGGYFLSLYDTLIAVAVAAFLMWTPLSRGLRNLAERITRFRGLQTFIFAMLYTLVVAALTFPFVIYTDFFREHDYGLSNLDLPEWLIEFAIVVVINGLLFSLLATAVYAVIRRAPRTWWIWVAGVSVAFMAVTIVIAPVVFSPLLNDFRAMDDGPLKDELLAMAHANGVPADNVYVFDLSEQTDVMSANVSGFLGTTRISLSDNLVKHATREQVRAVMGHEIGHYVLGHNVKFLVYMGVILVIAFGFAYWAFAKLRARFGERWGMRDQGDVAGLPVLIALLTVFFFAITPVWNSMIRENEAHADLFGLNAAREPDGFALAAMNHAKHRKLDPAPWEEIVFYDHPSGRSRIAMAMQWKAGHINDPDIAAKPSPGQ